MDRAARVRVGKQETGCRNRLSALAMAHGWKSVGGAQIVRTESESVEPNARNMGDALTTSGQPLLGFLEAV
jgi:hypothetical protein